MSDSQHFDLSEIVCHFESLEDPRSSVNRHHPLISVVTISLIAVLGGADGPTAIRTWAVTQEEHLKRCLSLPHGIPSKDVFRRVLMALRPDAFQACFVSWLNTLRVPAGADTVAAKPTGRPQVAVDGKCLRGSHDRSNGLGPLHLVSAWLTQAGLTLAQVATEEKSNEITAIPELLKLIDVNGSIITIDAMGTQTAIAKQIVDNGGDYVLALKGNQSGLQEAVVSYVDEHLDDHFAKVASRRYVEEETSHGRRDTRTYIQISVPKNLAGRSKWAGLRTIGIVIHCSVCGDKETVDVRHYISSLALGVKQFARAVRGHWGIENTCHWSLDVTYREDAQRTRHRTLAENLAWLRRFTLSLIKQHPGKESLIMKRRMCGWSFPFLMQVLTAQRP